LFHGRSLNTPAFLLAVWRTEGLVKPLGDKQRGYERVDPAEFTAGIKKLISSAVNLKAEEGGQPPESTPQQPKRGKKAKPASESAASS
jgi:hypothetical protein